MSNADDWNAAWHDAVAQETELSRISYPRIVGGVYIVGEATDD